MKAIERIRDIATQLCALQGVAFAVRGGRLIVDPNHQPDIFAQSVGYYLDEEAERRAKFEADVLDRLGKLQPAQSPIFNRATMALMGGNEAAPVGVYEGDGHPALRANYERTEEVDES